MWPFKRKKKPGFEFKSYSYPAYEWKGFQKNTDSDSMYSNFALLNPAEAMKIQEPKKPSRWKRFLCFILGHRWGFAGITYRGPEIPRTCKRCKKNKWFKK